MVGHNSDAPGEGLATRLWYIEHYGTEADKAQAAALTAELLAKLDAMMGES